jgi:hypothetical protein
VAEDDRLVGPAEPVVADPRRQLGPVVEPVAGVQVRPADPAAQHLEAHLTRARRRLGAVDDFEYGVLARNGLHPASLVALVRLRSYGGAV